MEQTQIEALKEKFTHRILDFREKSPKRYYIRINSKDVLEVIWYLFNVLKARFMIETGTDKEQGIEILYHFAFDNRGIIVTIRTFIPHDNPQIESIAPIITGAAWIEREIQDILGVRFLNHPDPRRFLMADDWPEGVYPFRRENGS